MGTHTRRHFLEATTAIAGGLALGAPSLSPLMEAAPVSGGLTAADLPKGAAPMPLALEHFPDRLHAFVWRNWSLVPVARMAKVVGARVRDIERIGRAMGLPRQGQIPTQQLTRSYLTIIKRNWHLLPYEQLIELLGWTAEQLAYTLREDDFLFVKLGNLKPACKPLQYRAPEGDTQARGTRTRQEEMARTVRAEIPLQLWNQGEPLFEFIKELSAGSRRTVGRNNTGGLRFCYSYFALYGDPLLDKAADPYPDGYLSRLAQTGVNGVWLQAVLYKLAPFPWDPARSAQYEVRLANLCELVNRAGRHGIKVLLYLNEPRAMPVGFFAQRPALQGVVEGEFAALCTSQPEVRQYLREAVASLCRAVPALGGFFTITASENLTHCWSHGAGAKCPRCRGRKPAEVVAEVNQLIQQGIHDAQTPARLIAWDWGWDDAWAGEAISQLPLDTSFMSVSEWQLPLARGGIKSEVGEYSISAIGPGPRARAHWELARKRGIKTLAKVQAGNTWELSSVPHIPAIANVAQHAERLRQEGIQELMLGWTLGGYPSPNLEVVAEVMSGASADQAINTVAIRRFGNVLGPAVAQAWRQFSAAFSEFPFHVGVLYSAPQQLGPANLLWPEPTRYAATMVGFPYDDLEAWRGVYPAEVFIQQFEKVAYGFFQALKQLNEETRTALAAAAHAQKQAFQKELIVAEAAAIHFQSVANQARFILARRAVSAAKGAAVAAEFDTLDRVLRAEITLARRLYELQCQDSRLGFEASNQYFYVPLDLAEKVLNCRYLLEHWLPRLRAGPGSARPGGG